MSASSPKPRCPADGNRQRGFRSGQWAWEELVDLTLNHPETEPTRGQKP
jgi:hypothetical protein